MNGAKIPFAFNLRSGSQPEPPVSNAEFLKNYLQLGVWFRVVPAHQQFEIIAKAGTSPLIRFCATAVFFEQVGMLFEDIVSTLVAWTIWAEDRNLSLADLLRACNLKRTSNSTIAPQSYIKDISAKFRRGDGRVNVDPRAFLNAFSALRNAEVLHLLGIPWKRFPSIKLVGQDLRGDWEQLPSLVQNLLRSLSSPSNNFLTAYFNKIKHGPQVIALDVKKVALERRGHDSENQDQLPDGEYLRILLHGSRTQETSDEAKEESRIAPFLLHNTSSVEQILFDVMVFVACMMWRLGGWLQRVVFHSHPPVLNDPMLQAIVSRASARAQRSAEANN